MSRGPRCQRDVALTAWTTARGPVWEDRTCRAFRECRRLVEEGRADVKMTPFRRHGVEWGNVCFGVGL